MEAVHGMRAAGGGGSAAPVGVHEAGARPGGETARKGRRRPERSTRANLVDGDQLQTTEADGFKLSRVCGV